MDQKPVRVTEPAVLIRINRVYRDGMSAQELYDGTRGVWRVGPRREGARYALAIFEGIVREVYEIQQWEPAGTTPYEFRRLDRSGFKGRWEFVGKRATEAVRSKYLGKSVADYFKRGSQAPVMYVNVSEQVG